MRVVGFAQERSCCTTLRIRQPLEKANALGLVDSCVLGLMDPNTHKAFNECDVLVFGRASNDAALDLVRRARSSGKKVVFDLDDNMFNVSAISPHYKDFGTMPVEFDNEDGSRGFLWQDGVGRFDVSANRRRRAGFVELIRSVDCITVSTPPLVGLYKRFNDNVVLVPNAIDFTVWEKPPYTWDKDDIRLLYTGAANHKEDWSYVVPVLERLQRRFGKLKIVLIGTDWKNVKNSLDYGRIEVHGWVDYEAYPHLMKTLCPDIGIAPISYTEFNDCRSSLKWIEYSALKCATVASDFGPYKRDMADGDTGMLVTTQDEWFDALSWLIEKDAERKRMALSAYNLCRDKYDLNYVVDDWMKAFQGAFE